jgi:hypothetical protein
MSLLRQQHPNSTTAIMTQYDYPALPLIRERSLMRSPSKIQNLMQS